MPGHVYSCISHGLNLKVLLCHFSCTPYHISLKESALKGASMLHRDSYVFVEGVSLAVKLWSLHLKENNPQKDLKVIRLQQISFSEAVTAACKFTRKTKLQ